MDITIHTNGIAIIEFLGEHEYKTGKSLFESYIKPTWKDCENIFYFFAPTKAQLFLALDNIVQASKNQGFSPIIHIESHGCENGLSTTPSGKEKVDWREIKPYFQAINRYSQFNTVVLVSACSGAHFASALDATDEAPFWAIVGPIEDAQAEDLLEDYGSFYRSFLSDFKFFDAFKKLNQHKDEGQRNYHLFTADHFFISLWAAYLHEEGTPTAIEKRVARVMSKAPPVTGAGRKAYGQMKQTLLQHLRDHRSFFEKFRRTYFMEETYPGMSERFGVTYEAVLERLANQNTGPLVFPKS